MSSRWVDIKTNVTKILKEISFSLNSKSDKSISMPQGSILETSDFSTPIARNRYLILNKIYFKTGIYCKYQFGKNVYQQFIKISTIRIPDGYPIKGITNVQKTNMEKRFNHFRDGYFNSSISEDDFIKEASKFRNKIYVPLIDDLQIKRREKIRKERQIIEDLQGLINQGIEIIQINFNFSKNANNKLIVLVDYGPKYPDERKPHLVVTRASILDLYPTIRKLKEVVQLDNCKRIKLMRYQKETHPQSYDLSMSITYNLLYHVIKKNEYNYVIDVKKIKTIGNISLDKKYCIATIPELTLGTKRSIPEIRKRKYISLRYGEIIQVICSSHDFNQFLTSYTFFDKLENRVISGTQKILVFSPNEFPGFESKNIKDIRLDLISFESSIGFQNFAFIFRAIDTIYGEKFVSSSADLMNILNKINEFDSDELLKIDNIGSFQELLANQLTNKSFIGDKSISRIYQIIRLFRNNEILNTKDKDESHIKVEELPYVGLYNTDGFSSSESFLLISLILYKLAIQEKKEGYKLMDYTLVIDDPRIIKLLANEDILNLFNITLKTYKGLRVIIHSTDPRINSNLIRIPQFFINQFDQKSRLESSFLKFGSSQKIEVNPIILSWEQNQLISGDVEEEEVKI